MMDADTATNRLLERDADIDALSDMEVKDAYARMAFYRAIVKARSPRFLSTPEADDVEQMLSEFNNSGLKQASIAALGRNHPVTQSLGWEDGPGNVETLFARLTKDDYTEEELIESAREHLKSALRGCGMPAMTVARSRVRAHTEAKDAEQ